MLHGNVCITIKKQEPGNRFLLYLLIFLEKIIFSVVQKIKFIGIMKKMRSMNLKDQNKKMNFTLITYKHYALPAVMFILLLVAVMAGTAAAQSPVEVNPFYIYDLSTFTGKIPFSNSRITVDESRREVYVADNSNHAIRIFNDRGLELYSFGDDVRFGNNFQDIVVLENGNLIVLSSGKLFLCNYRGEIRKIFGLKNLPKKLSGFSPGRMILRRGKLYFAKDKTLQVVVTDLQGKYISSIDIPAIMEMTPKEASQSTLGGFNVAEDGTILYTLPNDAHAYRLPPGSDEAQEFGLPGSGPGKLSVPQGIAPGPDGLIYIADVLKNTVLVFDKNLAFVLEFGGCSGRRGGLCSPVNLASTYNDCLLFVSQRGKEGISAFRVCQ